MSKYWITITVRKGYGILNEPQVFSKDQWSKIGKYYEYMIKGSSRTQTNKTIVLDMTIPINFHDTRINVTSENMAKIIPKDRNSIFKISLYGIPLDIIIKTENWNFY